MCVRLGGSILKAFFFSYIYIYIHIYCIYVYIYIYVELFWISPIVWCCYIDFIVYLFAPHLDNYLWRCFPPEPLHLGISHTCSAFSYSVGASLHAVPLCTTQPLSLEVPAIDRRTGSNVRLAGPRQLLVRLCCCPLSTHLALHTNQPRCHDGVTWWQKCVCARARVCVCMCACTRVCVCVCVRVKP